MNRAMRCIEKQVQLVLIRRVLQPVCLDSISFGVPHGEAHNICGQHNIDVNFVYDHIARGRMSPASEVVLRVRAYGQQNVEFALSGPASYENRGPSTWWLVVVLFFCSGGVLSTVEWGVSSSYRLLLGLLLAVLATWVFQASGNVIVEESMLVVPALGVKLSKRRRNGAVSSKFVDLDQICGVAVNEAITFSNVVYSLVFMVEGQSEMMLPFETFRPRVVTLQEIYQDTKTLLFPHGSDRKMRLPEGIAPRTC